MNIKVKIIQPIIPQEMEPKNKLEAIFCARDPENPTDPAVFNAVVNNLIHQSNKNLASKIGSKDEK